MYIHRYIYKGERFPTNDPEKKPVLDPKPMKDGVVCRKEYLHGILQGIANIEVIKMSSRGGYDQKSI
jgi:hypothetical protein